MNPAIFRAYDIRGIVDTQLTEDAAYLIGKALGTQIQVQGEHCTTIGRDGRLSSPKLSKALIKGILETGCDVIDIGMVPTPILYFSTFILGVNSGLMVTGSHNPGNYNGIKMVIGGKTLMTDDIQNLYRRIQNKVFRSGSGKLQTKDITERYIERVLQDVHLKRKLKVVVDAGNGIPGAIAPKLLRKLGCDVVELYCDVDGNFPNHHPDPSKLKNVEDLIKTVKKENADIGIAFDGDGDRIGVITPEGKNIWPDRQLMLYAKEVLAQKPGTNVIYDVKCSKDLETVIKEAGGNPIMHKTGHSLIKSKMRETNASLAGEMSGHIFFHDLWYGFDDAIYTAARLVTILAKENMNADKLFASLPESLSTPEINIDVPDSQKFDLMTQLIADADFKDAKIITVDGLRVEFADGWGLVRASNTTPSLVMRFEAKTQKSLSHIQDVFKNYLLEHNHNLVLPF